MKVPFIILSLLLFISSRNVLGQTNDSLSTQPVEGSANATGQSVEPSPQVQQVQQAQPQVVYVQQPQVASQPQVVYVQQPAPAQQPQVIYVQQPAPNQQPEVATAQQAPAPVASTKTKKDEAASKPASTGPGPNKSTFDNYYRSEATTVKGYKPGDEDFGKVDFQMNYIDSPLMDIVWCGEKKNAIFILTEKNTLYRSVDEGFTGHMLSDHLKKLGKEALDDDEDPEDVGHVQKLMQSPVDPNLMLIVGTHGINWFTEDCGNSFRAMNQGRKVDEFHFHPIKRTWLLAAAWTICEDFGDDACLNYKELFFSKDLGQNWEFAAHYVFDFAWGVVDNAFQKVPQERIIIAHDPKGKGHQKMGKWREDLQVSYSDDFFKTSKVILKGGNKFLLTHDFIFVVHAADESEQESKLYVGNARAVNYDLKPIEIPAKRVLEHGYTVVDTSQHSVVLHIDHMPNAPFGNLYMSDSTGTRYSLALKHNSKDMTGESDFERVQGLEGVYLANIFDDKVIKRIQKLEAEKEKGVAKQRAGSKKSSKDASKSGESDSFDDIKSLEDFKKTMISFDKGGMWQPLTPPAKDAYGKRIFCDNEDECNLHLHSLSSTTFGPFYSTENSLGLIMGTGNVGAFLSNRPDEVNTYLSRDAGLTWYEIAKGSHIYEIGDHGGLIVIAPDQQATQDIFYTWDEGMTWDTVRIFDKPVEVTNIIIEPSNIAEKFVVYGREHEGKRGVIAAVDFTSLHQRICQGADKPDTPESDYETWTPNGKVSPHCLLGKQVSYVRRKRESTCFNNEENERWRFVKACECTEEDWECDLGFFRQGGKGPCLPTSEMVKNESFVAPEVCDGYYYYSQGYRKVAGNVCQGGVDHFPIKLPCPGSGVFNSKNLSVLLVLGGILMMFIWLNNATNAAKVKGYLDIFRSTLEQYIKKSPSKHGYSNKIPETLRDDEDTFSNVIFDDDEDNDHPTIEEVNLIEENQAKRMTERRAMESANRQVPLLHKPGDKKHLDHIRGNHERVANMQN